MARAALAYIWLGTAETLLALFAACAMAGFMAGNISRAFAYIAEITTKGNRAKGMGLMGVTRSTTTMSRMVGPAIAGVAFGFIGINAPYFAGSILMLLVAFIAYWSLFRSAKV